MRLDQGGQLLHHVVVHAVVLSPGLLGGVEVETCAQTKVPGTIRVTRHLLAARAGVGATMIRPSSAARRWAPAFA